jgi:hypothetical protein
MQLDRAEGQLLDMHGPGNLDNNSHIFHLLDERNSFCHWRSYLMAPEVPSVSPNLPMLTELLTCTAIQADDRNCYSMLRVIEFPLERQKGPGE